MNTQIAAVGPEMKKLQCGEYLKANKQNLVPLPTPLLQHNTARISHVPYMRAFPQPCYLSNLKLSHYSHGINRSLLLSLHFVSSPFISADILHLKPPSVRQGRREAPRLGQLCTHSQAKPFVPHCPLALPCSSQSSPREPHQGAAITQTEQKPWQKQRARRLAHPSRNTPV